MKRSPIAVVLAGGLLLTAAAGSAWGHNLVVAQHATTQNQGVDSCGFDGQQDGDVTDPNCADDQPGMAQHDDKQSGQDMTESGQAGTQSDSMEQDGKDDGQQGDNEDENED
jgi:hypothetical protein